MKQGSALDPEPVLARSRLALGGDRARPVRRFWAGSLAVLALAVVGVWFFAFGPGAHPLHRVDDRADVLDQADLPQFERYLADLQLESGVDIRFVFVDGLPGESLEQFAVRTARALGIGRDLDRRSLLGAAAAGRLSDTAMTMAGCRPPADTHARDSPGSPPA